MDKELKNRVSKAYITAKSVFDYVKVDKVMQALDWKWSENGQHFPSAIEMSEKLDSLFLSQIKFMEEEGEIFSAFCSGGFEIEIDLMAEEVLIRFVVEESRLSFAVNEDDESDSEPE